MANCEQINEARQKNTGFQKFSYYQTLYNFPAEIKSVQKPRKGFGQGGFVLLNICLCVAAALL